MKFLLIFIIFTLEQAHASPYKLTQSQCADVDIRIGKPQAIKDFLSKPADQGDIGWCYGYVTTDLLTVETGSPLSVSHISSNYIKSIRSNPTLTREYDSITDSTSFGIYERGQVDKAVQMAIKYSPICIHNDLDLNLFWVKDIDWIHREFKEKQIKNKTVCETIQFYMPNLDYSLTNFMEQYIAKNINDDLEPMIRKNCPTKIDIPRVEAKVINKPKVFGKDKYVKIVNELLNSGKPLGIDYRLENITKLEGLHASTVIGRRWNKGRCEYNIRNSWGHTCEPYNKNIECNKEDGSFWLEDQDFFLFSENFKYLE